MNRYDGAVEKKATRYYAYSETLGRKRAGDKESASEAAAVEWARSISGSVNLVREEGPASKPTAVVVVWERHPRTDDTIVVTDAGGVQWRVSPSALTAI